MFHQISNTEKRVEKTRRSPVCLTNFEVFGYLMQHSFECLIELLKALIIVREIQNKSAPNFMIIRITYPNILHGGNFLSFLP